MEFSREQLGRVVNKTRTSEIVRKKQCIQTDEKLLQSWQCQMQEEEEESAVACTEIVVGQ